MVRNPQLDSVAHNILDDSRGSFLTSFAYTWLRADPSNRAILKPAFEKLIEKYDLRGSS